MRAAGSRKSANFHVEVTRWTQKHRTNWSASLLSGHSAGVALGAGNAAGKRNKLNTRNRRQNMAHVDGDDYTYESICTAEQHPGRMRKSQS